MSAPPCVSFNAMKNGRPRPTLLHRRSDIRKRFQKQFSRPMTGHTPRKLPSFDAISRIIAVRAVFSYTRSIIIPPQRKIVKQNFRENHKLCKSFSYNVPRPKHRHCEPVCALARNDGGELAHGLPPPFASLGHPPHKCRGGKAALQERYRARQGSSDPHPADARNVSGHWPQKKPGWRRCVSPVWGLFRRISFSGASAQPERSETGS